MEAFRNVQSGMGEKWEETLVKSEKEARRRKSFETGTRIEEPEVGRRVGRAEEVYRPRAPLKRKEGRVMQVAKEIAGLREEELRKAGDAPKKIGVEMETSARTGEIVASVEREKKRGGGGNAKLEEEKMRRVLEARRRRTRS